MNHKSLQIQGLKEVETKSAADTMRLLEQGGVNRTTAATAMNSSSSRSHAVFTVYMEQKHKEDLYVCDRETVIFFPNISLIPLSFN